MPTRTRRTSRQWQQIVDRHADSGQSARQYCQINSLSYPVFRKWRKQLSSEPQASLIDLTALVAPTRQTGWDIELDLGDGMALRLRRS